MEKPMLPTYKHCDDEISGDKRSQNFRLNKWLTIALVIVPLLLIATLTACKVYSLQTRLQELNSKLDTLEKGLTVDKKSLLPPSPDSAGVLFHYNVHKSRLRRHLTDGYTPVSHLTGSGIPGGARSVHLINNGVEVSRGTKFQWRGTDMSTRKGFTNMLVEDRTTIKIHVPGLYMVYAQVTYIGHPSNHGRDNVTVNDAGSGVRKKSVGHETVLTPHRSVESTVLMRSVHTSVRRRGAEPQDSGYHAGVFHLAFGDRVYVRPLTAHTKYNLSPENTFFGLFLVLRE